MRMRGVATNLDNEKLLTTTILAFAFLLLVIFVVEPSYQPTEPIAESGIEELIIFSKKNHAATARKILASSPVLEGEVEGTGMEWTHPAEEEDGSMNRMGETCSKANIDVFQGPTAPLPNGIPTYTVQIENVCLSGSCLISDIHLSCGWFSSARLINPSVFRRICYDDCLVNNGEPMSPGQSISFQYANSFQYPLYVSSVTCS